MATLIDITYFVLNINLPQATTQEGEALVQKFINKYEDIFLDKALGYGMAKAYKAGIALASPEQRWKDIRDGQEYSYGDLTDRWMGLRDSTKKLSPIANYIYFMFMKDKATDNTLVGVSKPKQSNATREDGETKMKDAWNEMVKWMRNLREFLYVNQTTYPEWKNHNSELYKYVNVYSI